MSAAKKHLEEAGRLLAEAGDASRQGRGLRAALPLWMAAFGEALRAVRAAESERDARLARQRRRTDDAN